jgi:hypothetical protein
VSPPKQKRAPAKSALQSAEQFAGYLISCDLQARRRMIPHGVACGACVPNRNAGDHDGKGALRRSSLVRIVAGPKGKEEQVLFGFVNEISLNLKQRDHDATSSILQPNSSHIATEVAGEKAALLRCCLKQNRRIN